MLRVGSLIYEISAIRYWQKCFICAFFFCYTLVQLFLFSVIHTEITQTLSINAASFGAVSSVMLYSMSLSLLPAGLLFDRQSPQLLLIIGAVLCLIGTLLISINFCMTTLILNRVLCGVANAIAFIGGLKVINVCYKSRVSLVTGVFLAIGHSGGIIVNMPYLWIKNVGNWSNLLTFNALIGVTVLFMVIFGLSNIHSTEHNDANTFRQAMYNVLKQLKEAMTNLNNWLCGIFAGIFCFPDLLLVALWGMLYLKQKHMFLSVEAGSILSTYLLGIIVGSPLIGMIADNIQRIRHVMIYASLGNAIIFLVMLWSTPVTWLFMWFFFTLGVFTGVASLMAFISIQENSKVSITATSLAFACLLMNLLSAFGQFLFGWCLDLFSGTGATSGTIQYSNEALDNAYNILPISFVLAMVLAYFIKNKPLSSSRQKDANLTQS